MSEAAQLDYEPTTPRRHWRRWGRVVLLATVVLVAGAGFRWRGAIIHHARLWHFQRQCLTYTRPPGTAVEPLAVNLPPACWRSFEAERRDATGRASRTTAFLHERVSPGGHRRLVHVEGERFGSILLGSHLDARVVSPATPWGEPHEMSSPFGRQRLIMGPRARVDFDFGQPDPDDASHFTIDYTAGGKRGTVDGWLRDDDTVVFRERGR